ncbi:hypothetical protein ALTERO38_60874 [Alteromonas sp. 38]|nr:hypothetical protein ALTER154_30060 [Alteromonas sp. 154]VXC36057.1 hypothetical protein ALTERO38_60874 [Alteromonas sp. 38]
MKLNSSPSLAKDAVAEPTEKYLRRIDYVGTSNKKAELVRS